VKGLRDATSTVHNLKPEDEFAFAAAAGAAAAGAAP